MRYVYYVQYLEMEHLILLNKGYKELHCLFVDGAVYIKMVSP